MVYSGGEDYSAVAQSILVSKYGCNLSPPPVQKVVALPMPLIMMRGAFAEGHACRIPFPPPHLHTRMHTALLERSCANFTCQV